MESKYCRVDVNMGDLDQGFEPTENVDHSQSTLGLDASLSDKVEVTNTIIFC